MDAVISVVALVALGLVAGSIALWRRGVRKQAGLMFVLAVVMIVNVLIWTLPGPGGTAPIDRAAQGPAG